MNDESIFAEAINKAPGAERRAFLDEACDGDEALRQRVERLLEADDRTAGILERGLGGLTAPHEPPGERPGDRVGPLAGRLGAMALIEGVMRVTAHLVARQRIKLASLRHGFWVAVRHPCG
jgi:hypothetical protein